MADTYSNLPHDLLELIVQKIKDCPLDVLRFRLVCRSWVKVSSPPGPNILSPVPRCIDSHTYRIGLVPSAVFLFQPPAADKLGKPWLVRVEERKPGKLYIQYPLSRCHTSTSKLLNGFPKDWSSRVKTLHNAVNFVWADDIRPNSWPYCSAVLLSDSDKTLTCVRYFIMLRTITVLRSGNHHGLWENISPNNDFDDVVSFQGQVYALHGSGLLFLVRKSAENDTEMITMVSQRISYSSDETRKRLVVSCQALYLVHRVWLRFRVYKVMKKENQWQWVEVSSVGDNVLFICADYCFSVSATDLPGWSGNCIVLHKHSFPKYDHYDPRRNVELDPALYTLFKSSEEELPIGIYYLGSDQIIRHISLFPGYSDVLWPPPSWIS